MCQNRKAKTYSMNIAPHKKSYASELHINDLKQR